jgi:hypothetical protein
VKKLLIGMLVVLAATVGIAAAFSSDNPSPIESHRVVTDDVNLAEPSTEDFTVPEYCVREGGFPAQGTSESAYPNCTWVDRIEEVPEGAIMLPSHGGIPLNEPERIRKFWRRH